MSSLQALSVPVVIADPVSDSRPDDASVGRSGIRARRERTRTVLGVVVTGAVLWAVVFAGEPVRQGAQVLSTGVSLALAPDRAWQALESIEATGPDRDAFPAPMVWRGDRLCIGFSRVDFPPDDRRPSLARCVPMSVSTSLPPNAIVVLLTLRSGKDTWTILEAAGPVAGVRVEFADGAELGGERILVHGSTFALRLPAEKQVSVLEWGSGDRSYRCQVISSTVGQPDHGFCPATVSPGQTVDSPQG